MKFKFFAFLILLLFAPIVSFGDICGTYTTSSTCNALDACIWDSDEEECLFVCSHDTDSYSGSWVYSESDGKLRQTQDDNGCIASGTVEYECSYNADGKWVYIGGNYSLKSCTGELKTGYSGFKNKMVFSKVTECKKDGYYTDSSGACTPCPVGWACVGGNKTQECSTGQYSAGSNVGADGTGGTRCEDCPAGYFCKDGKKTSCPGGQYSSSSKSTFCSSCPNGTYSNAGIDEEKGSLNEGSTGCEYCPAGYACKDGKPTACEAGTYTSETGQTQCKECEAGTYSNAGIADDGTGKTGSTGCNNCLQGTYNGNKRQSKCDTCPAGKYANDEGQTECSSCEPGSFCPGGKSFNELADINNEKNTFQAALKSTTGIYESNYIAGLSYYCPTGYMSDKAEQSVCDACGSTQTNSGPGSTSCDKSLFTKLKFLGQNVSGSWSWPDSVEVDNNIYNAN